MKLFLLFPIVLCIWVWSTATGNPVQCVDGECFLNPETEDNIQPKTEFQIEEGTQLKNETSQENTEPPRTKRGVLDTIGGSFKNATRYIGKKLHIIQKRQMEKTIDKNLNISLDNGEIKEIHYQAKNPKRCCRGHHIKVVVNPQKAIETNEIVVTKTPSACCRHRRHIMEEWREKRDIDSEIAEEVKTEAAQAPQANPPEPPAQRNIKIFIQNFVLGSQEADAGANATVQAENSFEFNDEPSTNRSSPEDDIHASV